MDVDANIMLYYITQIPIILIATEVTNTIDLQENKINPANNTRTLFSIVPIIINTIMLLIKNQPVLF